MRKARENIWALVLFCAATAAWAQTYPAKAVRIVVGFPPGGGNDIIARMVGAKMQETWGQPVVIDNKRAKLDAMGVEPLGNTQEQMAEWIRREIARYGPVVKAANIKAE